MKKQSEASEVAGKVRKNGAYRILIVDDEELILEFVESMLDKLGVKVKIETAYNGSEACVKLVQHIPDLVILDAIMPGANGNYVCNLVRKNAKLSETKIIVFTGYPQEGEKLLRLGADKVIIKGSKESSVNSFLKEVRRLLGIKNRRIAK